MAAGAHDRRPQADGGRGSRRRRRRLSAPPVHARRAAGPSPRRPPRGAAARRRRAGAGADGQRAGRHLPLGVARRLHARADQRRDRADLRLPGGELHRQQEADAVEHRASGRPAEHPDGAQPGAAATASRSASSTGSSAPTARSAGSSTAASSCPAPAAGCGATARSSTSPSAARPRRPHARARSSSARSEELHASRRRIVEAADNARRKIERDLHDGAQQRLVALALEVRMARARVDKDPSSAEPVPGAGRPGADRGLRRAARAGARHPPRAC